MGESCLRKKWNKGPPTTCTLESSEQRFQKASNKVKLDARAGVEDLGVNNSSKREIYLKNYASVVRSNENKSPSNEQIDEWALVQR